MPGILPMKVIKVGTSAQTRIAQACDRCRSKKIRCDGVRPSCTQCTNVGFECKTSDKLSRRAFPRGYTESLEERVRSLEGEVRELKDLLDEKDEKIDMLSRIHSHSPQSNHVSPRVHGSNSLSRVSSCEDDKDETFKINRSLIPIDSDGPDPYFIGTSSPRCLIDTFKTQASESGLSSIDERATLLLRGESRKMVATDSWRIRWRAPPRMLSDQLVNIFFQEWAPLYPVLHRPAFLQLYGDYVASPDSITNKHSLAQLHLVFGIASQSSQTRDENELASIEMQWRAAVDDIASIDTMATLQCLALAQIYCLIAPDHSALLRYKSLSITLSQRLGLHQSQKHLDLDTLECQTRKRVFWTLYSLDCFSATQLGLPRQMRDEDVQCEYPVDADDEYVTEKGFLPTLPGESTKISSALALFRVSRVLANVLQELYPVTSTYEVSFKTIASLSDELDAWLEALPPHLRLHFAQDKPSTNVVTSRSPLLCLAYQYVRSAIYRPTLQASHDLGDRASSSIAAVATAAKRTVQIVQLLNERNLSFSFCLNRNEMLISHGFGLLFQCLELDKDGKMIKDNQRMIGAIIELLERGKALGSRNFRKVACTVFAPQTRHQQAPPTTSRMSSESVTSISSSALRSTQKQLKALASRFSTSRHQGEPSDSNERRATVPIVTSHINGSQGSLSSIRSEPTLIAPKPAKSQSPASHAISTPSAGQTTHSRPTPNLDYLPLSGIITTNNNSRFSKKANKLHPTVSSHTPASSNTSPEIATAEWEQLIGTLDQGETNIYDSIYGGPIGDMLDGAEFHHNNLSMPLSADAIEAQNLVWGSASMKPSRTNWRHSYDDLVLGACQVEGRPFLASPAPVPRSVLSFSDESLTSGEDFGSANSSLHSGSLSGRLGDADEVELFKGLMIPADSVSPQSYANGLPEELAVLDSGFGL